MVRRGHTDNTDGLCTTLPQVIYCYEAQVDKTARGSGLGKHLMQVMHMVGMKAGLEKAMLTVFTRASR